ncbi:MAG: DUF3347 domain-containing protein [Sphingobacterium sp.]|jgi:copper chaperone CopZ|uniref:DUF3347 domain-containing protein n=1 Tax=Sphingobacterium sp. TaxID=341027 RepID=UPI00283F6754|nr:DUF3347 domain-containing protein [Sphingobacterium sp.]MDR3011068.1 DUF3347 domain-containing protein [Sphingobacterium sp.]
MKIHHYIITGVLVLSSLTNRAQAINTTNSNVKIAGNCGMCKKTIENAGTSAHAKVDWNEDNQTATISYDSKKTSLDAVLKNIAGAGYDNEKYLASEEAYTKLHACCQYERNLVPSASDAAKDAESPLAVSTDNNSNRTNFQQIYDQYFLLKDALVTADSKQAAGLANHLSDAISKVKVTNLTEVEQNIWKTKMTSLKAAAKNLQDAKDLHKQREAFAVLSEDIYSLSKSSKPSFSVYYQKCPMFNKGKGGTWLSRDKEIKNPYYGMQMLTCGSTVQTL